ncbi:MAG: glycosyltransferase family 2 protein [Candidatus Buchananbacteria bacterium]|nr:glycosyltransferase family 2 protein [Candidatus Buchananbacteria bacterium]
MSKKVLIIIVSYNSSDYIGDCLSSLENIVYPKDDFRILVVDNRSTDNSVEIIKKNFSEIELFESQANLGFVGGNNFGFKYAIQNNFDYVYLLNPDTAVTPGFLDQVVKLAESNQKIGAVQSKLLLYHDQGLINSIGNEIHFLGLAFAGGYKQPDYPMIPKEITYPSGASVLIKVSALKGVGFFNDEFFMYHEDTDLGWRLWLGGYKVMLSPESVVYHKYEFSRNQQKYYYMERNRRLMILQNYKIGTIILILPACVLMGLAMFIYSLFSGWAWQNLKVYWYFFQPSSWIKLFKTRKQIRKKCKITDREMLTRFVGRVEFHDFGNPILKYVVNPIFSLYFWLLKKIIVW